MGFHKDCYNNANYFTTVVSDMPHFVLILSFNTKYVYWWDSYEVLYLSNNQEEDIECGRLSNGNPRCQVLIAAPFKVTLEITVKMQFESISWYEEI